MASDEREADQANPGARPGDQEPGGKPPPPSWPRSLAPLAVIFALSLAVVLAILAIT